MNTEEVATKLVEFCRKGEWMKAIDELYGKDIVSVEPRAMENMPAEMRGIDQVRGKTEWWEKNMEVHSAKVGGPFVARDTFVVQFDVDVTDKGSKKRMQMSEAGIYTV
ncbi:MAG: nuclear transport factor 2 family protein, partial [Verrucomicrobia bacterium]